MYTSFIRNRSGVLLVIVGVLVCGFLQFFSLPVALYPRASKPVLTTRIWIKGQTSESFRNQYGYDIEAALQGVPNAEKVHGRYRPWAIEYTTEFAWGTESDIAKSNARAALSGIESKFPRGWETSYRFDGAEGSTLYLMVSSSKLSESEMSELVGQPIRTGLAGVEGMQSPWVSNFDSKDVIVELKPDKLSEFGVDSGQIRQALLAREFDQALGSIRYKETGDKQVSVAQKFRNLSEISNMLIRSGEESRVYLRDVADVKLEEKKVERLFKSGGKNGLIIGAATKPDANIAKACEEFIKQTKAVISSIDPDLKVTVLLNPGSYIHNAVRNIFLSVLLGVLVSTMVLFLFFGGLRHTLVIGLSIPLSLMGGFILMQVLGIEMNLVSLGAMALAAGMVVDGGVVVFENCMRLYEIARPSSYAEALGLVVRAMKEVRAAVIASVLTTSIVFAPLPFTSPIAAAILGDMAKVMVCVLLVSLLVALVILPALILYLSRDPMQMLPAPNANRLSSWFTRLVGWVQKLYESTLRLLLNSQRWRLGSSVAVGAVFLGSVMVMAFALESEIMPLPNSDQIFLSVRYKRQKFDIATSEKIIDAQEARILSKFAKYTDKTLSQVRERDGWVLVFLKNSGDAEAFKKELETEFKNTPLLRFWISPWVPSALKIPDPPAILANVNAPSKAARLAKLEQLDDAVSEVDSHGKLEAEPPPRYSDTFELSLRRENLGLVSTEFARFFDEKRITGAVRTALTESNLMDIELFGGQPSSVLMRYPENLIQSPQDLENLQLAFDDKFYALRHFADVKPKRLHREIVTEDGSRISRLSVWPKQTYQGSRQDFQAEVYQKLTEVFGAKTLTGAKKPMIEGVSFADADKEIRENTQSLVIAFALALLLVLILVCFQFGSLRKTLVVMLAVPFGMIGVSFSLYLFGVPLSVNSLLGLILLAGTAVNNSIVFVDFYDQLKATKPNLALDQLLLETAKVRFRPIAITTLTTIFGMLPIAIGLGEGGEIMRPLGVAVCGGLVISTALTILFVPVALLFVERLSLRISPAVVAVILGVLHLGVVEPAHAKNIVGDPSTGVSILDLNTVDKIVREKNSRFLNADLDVKVAGAQKYAAAGDFLPQISLDLTRELGKDQNGEVSMEASRGIRVTQSLSSPLRQAWKLSALSARQEITDLQRHQTQTDELLDGRLKLYALVQATELEKIAQKLLGISREYAHVAKKRYDAGLIDLSADLRSKNQLLMAKTAADNAARFVLQRRLELSEALQVRLASDIQVKQVWPERMVVESLTPESLAEVFSQVVGGQRIPVELAAQSKKVQAAESIQSLRKLFPEIVAEYQYQKRIGEEGDTGASSSRPEHQVQVGLIWDLFRGGKNYFETRAAVLQARKASNTLDRVKANFPLMVDVSRIKLQQALARKKLSAEKTEGLRKILAQSQKKFDRGLIDALALSQDIQSWVEAERSVVLSTMDALRVVGDLCKLASDETLFYKLI